MKHIMHRDNYPILQRYSSRYNERAWEDICSNDFEAAVISTWRLFYVEARVYLNPADDRKRGSDVRLIDNLSDRLVLTEIRIGPLHELRKLRNKYNKGGPVRSIGNWGIIKTAMEVIDILVGQNRPDLYVGGVACPDCGEMWELDFDVCDWCGWSHLD
jgi:hypothetical protein